MCCAGRSSPAGARCWWRWRRAPARRGWPPRSSSACSSAGAVTRVLFLVDRIPLAKQTEDAFAEHLLDLPAYVLRAGRRFQDQKRITITTLQSMVNIYRDYSAGYFDLVISDECHRSIYGKWSGVLKHFDGFQIGLTATPCVADPDLLGDEEDKLFLRDTFRFFEVDKPTFTYKLKDAIREGYLVPYQIYKAKTVKTAAEGGFPVRRDELDWSAMDQAARTELEEVFGSEPSIVVDPAALERRFTIPERNRAIVREYRDVVEKGYTDAKGVLRKPLLRQDNRVCCDQAPRRDARAAFRRRLRGPEAVARGPLRGLRGLGHG